LGVNSGATQFAIERQAVNEATFRCPDEMGWKPQVIWISSDYTISPKLCSLVQPISVFILFYPGVTKSFPNYYMQKVPIIEKDGDISRTRQVNFGSFIYFS